MDEIKNNQNGAIAKLRDAKILINDAQSTLARANDHIDVLMGFLNRFCETLNSEQEVEDLKADFVNIELDYSCYKKNIN